MPRRCSRSQALPNRGRLAAGAVILKSNLRIRLATIKQNCSTQPSAFRIEVCSRCWWILGLCEMLLVKCRKPRCEWWRCKPRKPRRSEQPTSPRRLGEKNNTSFSTPLPSCYSCRYDFGRVSEWHRRILRCHGHVWTPVDGAAHGSCGSIAIQSAANCWSNFTSFVCALRSSDRRFVDFAQS